MSVRTRDRGRRLISIAVLGGLAAAVVIASGSAASATGGLDAIAVADGIALSGTSKLRPAVRVNPPEAVASQGPVPPVPNRSTCRSDLPSPVMTITIADITYSCPVYTGRQAMIDAGAVTRVTDPAALGLLASRPADRGTLWIVAHRTTHGGAFADVPDLADGAMIVVTDDAGSAEYRVVGRRLVHVSDDLVVDATGRATERATLEALLRSDLGGDRAPRLVLQTCEGSTMRWMIYADLVTA